MVKSFKYLLSVLLMSFIGLTASAQTINLGSGITNPGGPVVTHNISDDGYAHVPLQFGFPYYGQTFTNSWMFDNGIVAFMDPVGTQANHYWNAEQFSQGMQPRFSYMIAPLWSDLKPVASTTYTTQGNQQSMTYTWTNLAEFYEPDNLNTFSLQIKPSGFIGVDYTSINITQSNVSVGLTGDLEKGQYVQHFWAPAGTNIGLESIPNWNVTDTGADQCVVDPLSSPACSGYDDAYFDQQCSVNVLYDPACPGYDTAYFDQQCSTDALYDPACPGYTTAYYDQQCGLDSLYHTGCPGYDDAYFDQQCDLDPLYDDTCPGYEDAYYVQQCTLDPLYDSGCTGYAEAFALKMLLNKQEPESIALVVDVEQDVEQPPSLTAEVTAAVQLVPTTPEVSNVSSASPTQSTTTTSTATTSEKKAAPRTTRQQLAEKRLAAAREKQAKQQIDMDSAESMEQQVELQNVVLGVMGFVPGFDAYGASFIPDGVGYKPFTIYENQNTVDNTRMLRGLSGASDRVHKQMIDSQYK